MKILLVDSNEPINNRNIKIIESLNKKDDIEIVLVSWKRNLKAEQYIYNVSKIFLFVRESPLGNYWKKIINMFTYYYYLKEIHTKEKPDIIIASHFDMLFLMSLLKRNKQYLIYENLDIPASSNFFVLRFLQMIEKLSLSRTDYIIHASRFYPQLYTFFKKEQQVLENLPKLDKGALSYIKEESNKIIISFIGGIRYIDILINLIKESLKFNNLEIRLHGEGHESEKLKNYLRQNDLASNVKMSGKYEYLAVPGFYRQSDFIWAVYPNKNHNVKFAISNKFHESIFFNVPGIFASNTSLGDFVEKKNIGLAVDPNDKESINNLLRKISHNKIDVDSLKKNMLKFESKEFSSWEDGIDKLYSWAKTKLNS